MRFLVTLSRHKKHLGQHFLKEKEIIDKIVDFLSLRAENHVVEIGPGQGVLTEAILPYVARVDAIEIDQDLHQFLTQKFAKTAHLVLHHADALNFDYQRIAKQKIRIIGNLPYQISSPILFLILGQIAYFEDMCFMLQHEFVARMAASVGTKQYGRLSVMMQYACHVQQLFVVPASAFNPPPKVMSAVVYLKPKKSLPLTSEQYQVFSKIVALAFGQRRKMCRNVLQSYVSGDDWHKLNIDPQIRPERLSVEDFIRITQWVQPVN